MRFALLGNHPDGLDLTAGLVEAGHELLAVTADVDALPREDRGPDDSPLAEVGRVANPSHPLANVRRVSDLEEILADPAVEAVIVAGRLSSRAAQLRRALQSERHVLCVHPADDTPEIAYEAALLQRDTGFGLLPMLVEGLHPAFRRLREFVQRLQPADASPSPIGMFQLLEVERTDRTLLSDDDPEAKPCLPGWDTLRAVGGEIIEVMGFAEQEELVPEQPILLAGRFEQGGLFRVTFLTGQDPFWRFVVVGTRGRVELVFPQGGQGPASLSWRDPDGEEWEEYFEPWNPWPALVELFEQTVSEEPQPTRVTWQDEIRCLELDSAVRRSVKKRRSDVLDFQEVSEEVGFKGTMTLVGCGLVWLVLGLLFLSVWFPEARWVILPLLLVFIGLQLFRYIIPRQKG
jgi:predicted dehydrogenase